MLTALLDNVYGAEVYWLVCAAGVAVWAWRRTLLRSKNAVVVDEALIYNGAAAVAKNWIISGVAAVSNCKTFYLVSGSDYKIAFDAGHLLLICDCLEAFKFILLLYRY